MSTNHFQNNRVVHRNASSTVQVGVDTQATINKTNAKLDLALVQHTAVNTKLDSFAGAPNNNIGVGASKLQVFPYAKDAGNSLMRPLTCDSNGRLECSVDALEVSMAQVNLNTDTLEAKIQATTDKLDSFAGAGNNTVGEGQSKLQVFNYGKDGSTYRPMTVDSSGHLQVDIVSTALPSGSATEATLAAAEVHLGAIQTAVQLIDNTVATSGSGAAGDKLQQVGGKFLDGTSRHFRTDTLGRVEVDIHTGGVIDTRLGALVTDAAATEVLITATNGLLTTLDGVQDSALAKLGEIETSANALIAANHTDLVALEASLTSMEGKMDVDNVVYDNQLTKLTNIETAVQILDNAISGNEMQVDVLTMPTVAITHSALTELAGAINLDKLDVVVTNSPAVTATLSATDNAVIDVIAANTQGLENVNGKITACNTGAVVISSGAVTASLSATDNAVLDSIVSKNTQIETLLTAANVDHAANEVLLGTIDADTDAIKTSSAACATDLAAIEVLLTSANTDHAANEVLLTGIDADTDAIKTSTAACATDLAAIEVLQTAANTDLAAIEVLLTSANTDHAANEALLTTIDADTNNIKTSTAACATDLAAIEVLQTAANTDLAAIEVLLTSANTDHAANEALLTTIDADTGAIKTAVQLIDDAVHAEDSAHSNSDKGIPCLAVRKDTQTQLAGSDADYGMLQTNATGALRVHNNKVFTTEATLHSTVDCASGGSATLSSAIANDPNIDRYHLRHGFETNNSVKYRILQANTASQNPYITIGDPSLFFNDASTPAGATTNGMSPDIEVQLPFFKIEYTNNHNANQEVVMNFVGRKTV